MPMEQEMTMAGGGKIQQSDPNRDIAAMPVPYLQNAKAATIPAFVPGQQQQLAAQLGAGFGASPASFANHLNQVYSPAQTLTYKPRPAEAVDANDRWRRQARPQRHGAGRRQARARLEDQPDPADPADGKEFTQCPNLKIA